MDGCPQNVLGPRQWEFPAGLEKGAGLAWSERDPTREGPPIWKRRPSQPRREGARSPREASVQKTLVSRRNRAESV